MSVFVLCPVLGACEHIVHSDTKLSQGKIALHRDAVFREMAVRDFDAAALAAEYLTRGAGGLDIGVRYDPAVSGAAMRASGILARFSRQLKRQGVERVQSAIVPVKGSGTMVVLVAFTALEARAPEDCGVIDGLEDRDIDPDADYKIGCSLDGLIAKQVARPSDLAGGRDVNYGVSDGRRASNITEPYRAGVRNEPLEGESASE